MMYLFLIIRKQTVLPFAVFSFASQNIKMLLVVNLCLLALPCLSLFTNAMPVTSEWIELSYPFNSETIYWPTVLSFKHSLVFANYTKDGYYYSSYDISASEHGGTHLDSPRHFAEGSWTTDEIPLDRLIGQAIKIDVSSKAAEVVSKFVFIFCCERQISPTS